MPKKKLLVQGEILFKDAKPFSDATVYIRIEDVSRADAASTVVAEEVMRGVSYKPRSKSNLKFKVYGQPPDEKASCSVRVHVDVDNDGQITTGDYLSMESYPVLSSNIPDKVSVNVYEVN